jgi:uncharacterized repeat protein (TIGR01451 family)
MKAMKLFSLSCLIAVASLGLVNAQQPQIVLNVQLEQELTITDDTGKPQVVRRKVDKSKPGDLLVYTLVYTNSGSTPVNDATVNDPVPVGTVLLPGSATGEKSRISFSADAGKSYSAFPAQVDVIGPDGKTISKKASADEYTHIRWVSNEPLGPGESRIAEFKVLVQ